MCGCGVGEEGSGRRMLELGNSDKPTILGIDRTCAPYLVRFCGQTQVQGQIIARVRHTWLDFMGQTQVQGQIT